MPVEKLIQELSKYPKDMKVVTSSESCMSGVVESYYISRTAEESLSIEDNGHNSGKEQVILIQ